MQGGGNGAAWRRFRCSPQGVAGSAGMSGGSTADTEFAGDAGTARVASILSAPPGPASPEMSDRNQHRRSAYFSHRDSVPDRRASRNRQRSISRNADQSSITVSRRSASCARCSGDFAARPRARRHRTISRGRARPRRARGATSRAPCVRRSHEGLREADAADALAASVAAVSQPERTTKSGARSRVRMSETSSDV